LHTHTDLRREGGDVTMTVPRVRLARTAMEYTPV